jgi:T1SS-143 domain-containing protein
MSIEDPRLSMIDNTSAADEFDSAVEQHLGYSGEAVDGIEVAQAQTPETGRTDRLPAQEPVQVAAATIPTEVKPNDENVVTLPAGIELDNLEFQVDGENLVIVLADGTEIVVVGGAANIPTFVIGEVELPQVALFAALEGSNINIAAGPDGTFQAQGTPDTSRNFQDDPIDSGPESFALAQLLGDTDFGDGVQSAQETGDNPIESVPLFGTADAGFVDEDYLEDGNKDGGTSKTATGSLGIVWGSDDDNAIIDGGLTGSANDRGVAFTQETLDALRAKGYTSDGVLLDYAISDDGTTIIAYKPNTKPDPDGEGNETLQAVAADVPEGNPASQPDYDGEAVFQVSVSDATANGSYTFELIGNLDHPDTSAEDDITIEFEFTAQDSNGDQGSSSFTVTVNDDSPVQGEAGTDSLTEDNVSEYCATDDTPGDATKTDAISLGISWGADNDMRGEGDLVGRIVRFVAIVDDEETTDPDVEEPIEQFAAVFVDNGRISDPASVGLSITGGTFTSEGRQLEYVLTDLDNGGQTLTAYIVGTETRVFEIVLDPTADNGAATVEIFQELDHNAGSDSAIISVRFQATDSDGDSSTPGTFSVTIQDDVLEIGRPEREYVDEDGRPGLESGAGNPGSWGHHSEDSNGGTSERGDLNISWGADDSNMGNGGVTGAKGDRGVAFTGSAAPAGVTSNGFGLFYAYNATHTELVAYRVDSEGYFIDSDGDRIPAGSSEVPSLLASPEGDEAPIDYLRLDDEGQFPAEAAEQLTDAAVFEVTLSDQGSGSYTFTLLDNLDHRSQGEDNLDLTFNFTASDADGDQASSSFTVVVDDDTPVFYRFPEEEEVSERFIGETEAVQSGNLYVSWGADNANSDVDGGVAAGKGDRYIVFRDQDAPRNLTSNGIPLTYVVSENGTALTAYRFNGTNYVGPEGQLLGDEPTDAARVFEVTLSDQGTGSYTFTLIDNLDHVGWGQSSEIDLKFDFKAVDSDGDVLNGSFEVDVRDGGPSLGGRVSSSIVDEEGILGRSGNEGDSYTGKTGSAADASGTSTSTGNVALNINWGNDSDLKSERLNNGQVDDPIGRQVQFVDAWGNGVSAGNISSQQVGFVLGQDFVGLKSGSQSLSYKIDYLLDSSGNWNGGYVLTASAGQATIFTVTLDPTSETGSYKFDLLGVLNHQNGGQAANSENDIELNFRFKAIDSDGDATDVGRFKVTVDDDAPVAGVVVVANVELSHDETGGAQQNTADDKTDAVPSTFSNLGTVIGWAQQAGMVSTSTSSYGADGAGSTTLALTQANGSTFNGVSSGLESLQGQSIQLYSQGNLVVGKVGNVVYFAVSIENDGTVSIAQYQPIKHTPNLSENDIESILNVHVTVTVTDRDGDVKSATTTSPLAIKIVDDGPSVNPTQTGKAVDEDGLYFGNAARIAYDGDNTETNSASVSGTLAYSFGTDGKSGAADDIVFNHTALQALNLESLGTSLCYSWDNTSNTLTAKAGSNGPTVFTLQVTDVNTGAFTFTLNRPLDHDVRNTEDDINIDFGFTIKDADGDTASGSIRITIDDDAPFIGTPEAERVSEASLPYTWNDELNPNGSNSAYQTGDLKIFWGADNQDNVWNSANRSVAFASGLTAPAGLTSDGDAIRYVFNDDRTELTAVTGSGRDTEVIFKVTLNDDGSGTYEFRLVGNIDHDAQNNLEKTLSFGFTAKDSDGDTASSSFNVTIEDQTASLGTAETTTVDEEFVSGSGNTGLEHSYPGDVLLDFTRAEGDLNINWGADDNDSGSTNNRSVRFDGYTNNQAFGSVTADGAQVKVWVSQDGLTLYGYVGSAPSGNNAPSEATRVFVVTLNDDDSGSYNFTLLGNLDHSATRLEDNLELSFNFKATDSDGDTTPQGQFKVLVNDDASRLTGATNSVVDEDGRGNDGVRLPGANPNSAPGDVDAPSIVTGKSLGIEWGADNNLKNEQLTDGVIGAVDDPIGRTVAFADASASQAATPLAVGTVTAAQLGLGPLTSGNVPLVYTISYLQASGNWNGGYVLTATKGEGGIEVFKVTLDPTASNGAYSFELKGPLDHAYGDNTEGNLNLNFKFAAFDADGDAASNSNYSGQIVNGSFTVTVNDDMPGATSEVLTGTANEVLVADGNPVTPAVTGSLATLVSFGADGAHATNAYTVETQNLSSSLTSLKSNGASLDFALGTGSEANTLIATNKLTGERVFTFAVDPQTGAYTFTQVGPIDHTQTVVLDGVSYALSALPAANAQLKVPEVDGPDFEVVGRLPNGDVIIRVTNDGNSTVNWTLDNNSSGGADQVVSLAAHQTAYINVGNISANSQTYFDLDGTRSPDGWVQINRYTPNIETIDGRTSLTLDLSSAVTVRDVDGDALALSNQLKITVTDSTPSSVAGVNGEVFEDGTKSIVGRTVVNWNADNGPAKTLVLAGNPAITDANGSTVSVLKSNNQDVLFATIGGVLIAYLASGSAANAADRVFTLSLDAATGSYTFTLLQPLDHTAPNGNAHYLQFAFNATATDADGDALPVSFNVKVDAAGTINGDTISYAALSSDVFVNLNNTAENLGSQLVAGRTATDRNGGNVVGIDALGAVVVNAEGGSGDDILAGNNGANLLKGGDGDDLLVGNDGDDTLVAGKGADRLEGGAGRDTLVVSADIDVVSGYGPREFTKGDGLTLGIDINGLSGEGDALIGGSGIDTVKFEVAAGASGFVFDRANSSLELSGVERFEGTDGDDVILLPKSYTTSGSVLIEIDGGKGDDTLQGSNLQGDKITGGEGDDLISGLGGNDQLFGGEGNDEIWGGAGRDTIDGGDDADKLYGNDGDDDLRGGAGDDIVNGGAGADLITGDDGADTLIGGGDNDDFFIGGGSDTVYGNETDLSVISNRLATDGESDEVILYGDQNDYAVTRNVDGSWQITSAEESDTLYGIEHINFNEDVVELDLTANVLVFNAANQLVGTFATIQAGVTFADAGFTVEVQAGVYNEAVVIGEGITLKGVGDVVIDGGETGPAITVNGGGALQSLLIDGIDLKSSSSSVILVDKVANFDTVTLKNGDVTGGDYHGLFVDNATNVEGVVVEKVNFSGNATTSSGGSGEGPVTIFLYNGNVTFKDVTVSDPGAAAENGIQLRGVDAPFQPLGTVVFDNVDVSGTYSKVGVAIYNYANANGLQIVNGGLDVNVTANWFGLKFETVGGTIDLSGLPLTVVNAFGAPSNDIGMEGTSGNETFTGDDSDDFLFGLGGGDLLKGGAGNDAFLLAGDVTVPAVSPTRNIELGDGTLRAVSVVGLAGTADIVQGGAGADVIVLDRGTTPGYVHDTYSAPSYMSGIEQIVGTSGKDVILVDDAYLSDAAGGGITISGGDGDDVLGGGAGTDTISGGADNDLISGLGGNDELYGNAGVDEIWGGAGNDTLDGGADNDTLYGNAGDDTVRGGEGNDTIVYKVGEGRDIVDGGTETVGGRDLLQVEGSAAGEAYVIWSKDAYNTAHGNSYAGTAEILLTVNGAVVAEVTEIEDIVINGGGGADTLTVNGSFTGTSLLTSTITYNGGAGDETFDVSGLASGHSVVVKGAGGNDKLVLGDTAGEAKWQDVTVTKNAETGEFTITMANGAVIKATGVESFQFQNGTVTADQLVQQAPSDITTAGLSIAENASAGASVGSVAGVDINGSIDPLNYAFVKDGQASTTSADGRFTIDPATGEISVLSGAVIDFEATPSINAVVRVTDSRGGSYDETVSVTVTNVNEAPTAINFQSPNASSGFSIEVARSSTEIVNLASADALLAGTNQTAKQEANSATVNFGPGGNFSGDSIFPSGGGDEFAVRATGTINITTSGTWTFGTHSDDGVRLKIDGQVVILDDAIHPGQNTFGQVYLTAGQHTIELVYFEHQGGELLELFAQAGAHSSWNDGFKLIGDVANGGLAVTDGLSIDENNVAGAVVATLTATDVDAGDTHSFQLVAGEGATDNALFTIVGNELRLIGSADYETKASYTIRVQATDAGGETYVTTKTIVVNDLVENIAPTANADHVITNAGIGSTVYVPEWALLANDEDDHGPLDITGTSNASDLSTSLVTEPGSVAITDTGNAGGSFNYTVSDGTMSGTGSVTVSQDTIGELDGTNGNDIIVAGPVVEAKPQITTIGFNAGGYDAGDVVSITVDGVRYSHTVQANARSAENVYDALKAVSVGGVTLAASLEAKGVEWSTNLTGNSVTLTSDPGAENGFTISADVNNDSDAGRPWITTVDFYDSGYGMYNNASLSVTINGNTYSAEDTIPARDWYDADDYMDSAASNLLSKLNAVTGVAASFDSNSNTFTIQTTFAATITGRSGYADAREITQVQTGSTPSNQGNLSVNTSQAAVGDPGEPQTTTIRFASSYDAGDVVSITVDGVIYSHTVLANARTGENVYDALKAVSVGGVTLAASLEDKGVEWAANLDSNAVTLVSDPGSANGFGISAAVDNNADVGIPWINTVDFSNSISEFSNGRESITITINGTPYSYSAIYGSGNGSNFDNAAAGLVGTLNGVSGVTAEYNRDQNTFTIQTTFNPGTITATSTSNDTQGDVNTVQSGTLATDQAAPDVDTTHATDGGFVLNGLDGNDILIGSDGDDILNGGDGNDILFGGSGFDTLTGGDDADTFRFDETAFEDIHVTDVITDYNLAEGDALDVTALLDSLLGEENEATFATHLRATVDGGNTTVSVQTDADTWKDVVVLQDHTTAIKVLFEDKHATITPPHND